MNIPGWTLIAILLLGGFLFGSGAYFMTANSAVPTGAVQTKGVVIRLLDNESKRPVVEYTVGVRRFVYAKNIPISRQSYSIGDSVNMKYWPMAPEDATINTSSFSWFLPMAFLFCGTTAIVFGLFAPSIHRTLLRRNSVQP
jgi:hypothetical protein